jgi:[ribosomal protein S18]-alanine N-acetyltransferase
MQPSSNIRKATLHDFERIVEIEQACFYKNLAYNRRQLNYLLTKAHSTVLVETQKNIVRGFIIVLYRKGTKVAGIETVNVDPIHRKQGIAKDLLKTAEQIIRKKGITNIRLEVSTANKAALHLYESMGFKKTGFLKNYYLYNHDGSRDALRMIKEL